MKDKIIDEDVKKLNNAECGKDVKLSNGDIIRIISDHECIENDENPCGECYLRGECCDLNCVKNHCSYRLVKKKD